jgi:hypothetical protein
MVRDDGLIYALWHCYDYLLSLGCFATIVSLLHFFRDALEVGGNTKGNTMVPFQFNHSNKAWNIFTQYLYPAHIVTQNEV